MASRPRSATSSDTTSRTGVNSTRRGADAPLNQRHRRRNSGGSSMPTGRVSWSISSSVSGCRREDSHGSRWSLKQRSNRARSSSVSGTPGTYSRDTLAVPAPFRGNAIRETATASCSRSRPSSTHPGSHSHHDLNQLGNRRASALSASAIARGAISLMRRWQSAASISLRRQTSAALGCQNAEHERRRTRAEDYRRSREPSALSVLPSLRSPKCLTSA
jgi:hypothetical protein